MGDSDLTAVRRKAQRRGRISEYVAAVFLMLKGYRIMALRHRTRLGEIDIVARKGDLAVFVEVKARHGEAAAVDAVSAMAQKRIRAAAICGSPARRIGHAFPSATISWRSCPAVCRGIFRMPSDIFAIWPVSDR